MVVIDKNNDAFSFVHEVYTLINDVSGSILLQIDSLFY